MARQQRPAVAATSQITVQAVREHGRKGRRRSGQVRRRQQLEQVPPTAKKAT